VKVSRLRPEPISHEPRFVLNLQLEPTIGMRGCIVEAVMLPSGEKTLSFFPERLRRAELDALSRRRVGRGVRIGKAGMRRMAHATIAHRFEPLESIASLRRIREKQYRRCPSE
jgi:hypothetical protein